jgi:hypothetical protein
VSAPPNAGAGEVAAVEQQAATAGPIVAEACRPALFARTWCSGSQLPEVRGRGCTGAASASLASAAPDLCFCLKDPAKFVWDRHFNE